MPADPSTNVQCPHCGNTQPGGSNFCGSCGKSFAAPPPVQPPPSGPAQGPPHQGDGFQCPTCGSTATPEIRRQVSQAGWIVLIVMVMFCPLFFWIGLLMKEDVHHCSSCGVRFG